MYVSLPSRTLFSDEISDIVITKLGIKGFRGVYMRDELQRLKTPYNYESGIVNLNTHTQPGSHWICYAKIGKDLFYFDSFGVYPTDEVIRYLKSKKDYELNLPRIEYNVEVVQHISSHECGALCIYVLSELCMNHRPFSDIIQDLKNRYDSNKAHKLKIKL